MQKHSDIGRGGVADSDDSQSSESQLLAVLFEAGKRDAVPSDAVMDVLLEALKSGRDVADIVEDHDILSKRQRESIQRIVSQHKQNSTARRNTVAAADQYPTPQNTPAQQAEKDSRPTSRQQEAELQFQNDHAEYLPFGTERYSTVEEIGRGGWGVVVRAVDKQLERDVAVKKLGEQASRDSDVARRFLHEARITAQLQHPGIVPVYERGVSLDDKQPFYAMKLLQGVTLRDVIRDYHAMPTGRDKRKQFHVVLNSFIDVCHALGYAHSRQIIHRDLKPSNVVIGEFGETVVVDWGLAKDLNDLTQDVEVNIATLPAGTPLPNAGATTGKLGGLLDPAITCAGSIIGTPAFMSPEQARGAAKEIDTTSDTYSLGIILYTILTGELPFHGDDVQTTLQQVIEGEYRHPKTIDKRTPSALASICVKAMNRERSNRYQNAGEMAVDLQQFLANESVTAHKDTLAEKAGRWCRRNPTLAATTVVGAIILAVTSAVATGVVSKAHREERTAKLEAVAAHKLELEARKEAESAKARALQRLEESRAAADTWLLGLSGTLERYPGMQPVRLELLEQAKQHYQELYTASANDPELKLEAARCLLRLGDLHVLTNAVELAHKAFTDGAAILRQIGKPDDVVNHCREQLNAEIGLLLVAIQNNAAVKETAIKLLEVVEAVKPMDSAGPAFDELKMSIARSYTVIGRAFESVDESQKAIEAFETALQWADRLDADRTSTRKHHLLSTIRQDLARVYSNTIQHEKSAVILKDHIESSSLQLEANTDRPDLLESRAIAQMHWAATQRNLGEDWAAEGAYRSAVEDLSNAWQLMFGNHFYNENLAVAQANLGQLALRLNRLEDAENMLRDAVDQLTGLMQSGQADRETASRLAACNVSLGHVLVIRGNPAAEEQIKRSIDIYAYLAKESTLTPTDQLAQARAIANLGCFYEMSGDLASAIEYFQQALEGLEETIANSNSESAGVAIATVQLQLARILKACGEHTRSKTLQQNAVKALAEASAEESGKSKYTSDSATVFLLRTLLESTVPPSAEDLQQAIDIQRNLRLTSSAPEHLQQIGAITDYLSQDYEQAAKSIERTIASRRFPSTIDWAIQGCICVKLGNKNDAERFLERAIAGMTESPGDPRVRVWVSELMELLQPLQPDSNRSTRPSKPDMPPEG